MDQPDIRTYTGPAGGWGSAQSLLHILRDQGIPASGALTLLKQNKTTGFACVSCAWAKPSPAHPFEFCENGAKATAWELTGRRVGPEFFAANPVADLRDWTDHDLEDIGRLTHPLRWDAATDRYLPVSWDSAFTEIARELAGIAPDDAVFYASGRASLEASYMWGLLARLYGTNNLPDSSNMCHESTSIALPKTIGVPVGTVTIEDFHLTDCLMFFGQNPGVNSPRLLNDMQECAKRGVPIISFNPLRERGLERFKSPQHVTEMLSPYSTKLSTQYLQVKIGGDIAAMSGLAKWLITWDDASKVTPGAGRVLDAVFIAAHTEGFEAFAARIRALDWAQLEEVSGLTREALEGVARTMARSKRIIALYGMGLTQHRKGVENITMLTNLLLMLGQIGKPGAGICPVRGHSNVQGQRTVGITEKPEHLPIDKLEQQYRFTVPRKVGQNTVEACDAILAGQTRAFISLGGNFIRAVPEQGAMEAAWTRMRLTVQVSTKLNRSHLVHGEISYILPCLGRTERDRQTSGDQSVTIEDSTACIHGSKGFRTPPGPEVRSEHAIIAGIARAMFPGDDRVPWEAWLADYSRIRDAIAVSYPEIFHDFNDRMWQPGGFHRPIAARERIWQTANGKANFITPTSLDENPDMPEHGAEILRLMTIRSNDQFNTTIYGYDDRFRGIRGTRMVVLMNKADMVAQNLREGERVTVETVAHDGVTRQVRDLRVTGYDIPRGCAAAYYPECNPLVPVWHYAEESKVPAAKSIPVRILK